MGLSAALKNLLDDFQTHYQIQECALQLDDIDNCFPPKWRTIIYRIIQELLTNISKHAEATWVSITTKIIGKKVLIEIKDNGRGFDSPQVTSLGTPKSGLGLLVIAERIKMLGGHLDIHSQPNQGTQVSITIPVF